MNCWHCQKELPTDYSATYCLFCGQALPPRPKLTEPFDALLQNNQPANWRMFWVLLFLPAILTLITMMLNLGEIAVMFGLVGSIFCGVIAARTVVAYISLSGINRVLAQIAFSVLLFGLSLFISAAGCTVGAVISNHSL